jgi:hypothetical protein
MKGCRNCVNWQSLDEFLDRVDPATNNQKVQLGRCRRYAPHPLTPDAGANGAESDWESHWPRVASDDWCGEWDPQFD